MTTMSRFIDEIHELIGKYGKQVDFRSISHDERKNLIVLAVRDKLIFDKFEMFFNGSFDISELLADMLEKKISREEFEMKIHSGLSTDLEMRIDDEIDDIVSNHFYDNDYHKDIDDYDRDKWGRNMKDKKKQGLIKFKGGIEDMFLQTFLVNFNESVDKMHVAICAAEKFLQLINKLEKTRGVKR